MKRVKYARLLAKKTVRSTSIAIGVTDTPIYAWESGKTEPSLSQAAALASFYGCDLTDLVGDVPPGTTIPVELLGRVRTRSAPPADLPRAGEG